VGQDRYNIDKGLLLACKDQVDWVDPILLRAAVIDKKDEP